MNFYILGQNRVPGMFSSGSRPKPDIRCQTTRDKVSFSNLFVHFNYYTRYLFSFHHAMSFLSDSVPPISRREDMSYSSFQLPPLLLNLRS